MTNLEKTSWQKLRWTILGILVLIIALRNITPLRTNIAAVLLQKTMVEVKETTAAQQRALRQISWLLDGTEPLPSTSSSDFIFSFLQGVAAYREGELSKAAAFFRTAANSQPLDANRDLPIVSPWVEINAEGDLHIPNNSPFWRIRPDKIDAGAIIQNEAGELFIHCQKNSEQQTAAFVWEQPLMVKYHHTVALRARADVGTTLILATVTDDGINRLFTHPGTGEIEQMQAPIEHEKLRRIYLLIRPNEMSSNDAMCRSQILSLSFKMDAP